MSVSKFPLLRKVINNKRRRGAALPFSYEGGHHVDMFVWNAAAAVATVAAGPVVVHFTFHNEKKLILGRRRRDTDINEEESGEDADKPPSWEMEQTTDTFGSFAGWFTGIVQEIKYWREQSPNCISSHDYPGPPCTNEKWTTAGSEGWILGANSR